MLVGWQGSCTHKGTSLKLAASSVSSGGTSFEALSAKQAAKQSGRQAAKKAKRTKQSESTSTSTKPKQKPKQHKWQRHAQQQQPKAAVEVRRGDFGYREPPWRLTYNVTAEQLQSAEDIRELAAEACHECQVRVDIAATPLGAGYFLKGTVNADVPLPCSYCSTTFTHPVKGSLTVWLDASLDADADPADPNQVPFPREMQAVGLDSEVNDAIFDGLPDIMMCGRPNCTVKDAELDENGVPRWPVESDSDELPHGEVVGPFAVLQKLKKRN